MAEKRYFKELNGYYVKDEEAREQANDVDLHVKSLDNGKLRFHSIAGSSATYIVEFPNGKNMIIDTGKADQWSDIKSAIDGLGITKFDYAVITHFHSDHAGNIQNIINNYDMSGCTWYIGMKPDYINHSAVIKDNETAYDNGVQVITSNGYTPIVPTNGSTITVDEENEISIRFLNTDSEIAENYYSRYTEFRDGQGVNFNVFSLITEIKHNNVTILATGDIERPTEEQYTEYLGKVNIMTAPHHGINADAERSFYYATMPDYAICSYIPDTLPWITTWYKSFELLKEVGSKIISATSSVPVDGLYTFISDGNTVATDVKNSGVTSNEPQNGTFYSDIRSLIPATSIDAGEITLSQALANLPLGHSLKVRWLSDYPTKYAQIYTDLLNIFPKIATDMTIEFIRYNGGYEIRAYGWYINYFARKVGNGNWQVRGDGVLNTAITSQDDLIDELSVLPIGQYIVNSYTDTAGDSGVLVTNGAYTLSVDKPSATIAKITGVLRNTDQTGTNLARAVFGYMNTGSTPKIVWHKVNNAE